MMLRQYRVFVDLKGRIGKEADFPFLLYNLLFTKFESVLDSCGLVVLKSVVTVHPLYRSVIIQRCEVSHDAFQCFSLCVCFLSIENPQVFLLYATHVW